VALQTSRQVRDHLLCSSCEDLFNRSGERWVLGQYYNGKTFILHDTLSSMTPVLHDGDVRCYAAAGNPHIDFASLAYFAISVFWRSAVHRWPVPGGRLVPIDLGSYEDELRLFLLGTAGFPSEAVIIVCVTATPEPPLAAYAPLRGREREYHYYRFTIPGMAFTLCIGRRIPAVVRKLCILRSPGNLIFMAQTDDTRILGDIYRLANKKQIARRIRSH